MSDHGLDQQSDPRIHTRSNECVRLVRTPGLVFFKDCAIIATNIKHHSSTVLSYIHRHTLYKHATAYLI